MDNEILLFTYIKQHKWNNFIQLLASLKEVDVNIKDENSNYLINYTVIYNQTAITKKLLELGARIDVIDADNKSLLYYTIKYNYLDQLKLLLEYDKKQVGISITHLTDKDGNIGLFYALKFNNLPAVKLLVEAGSNINHQNNLGQSPLLLAVLTRHTEYVQYILSKHPNINITTKKGETALHVACNLSLYDIARLLLIHGINVNTQDNDGYFTALMSAINLREEKIINLLLEYEHNYQLQDSFGNTVIHYCIIQELYEILNKIYSKITDKKKVLILNLTNIRGRTALHELFYKPSAFIDNNKSLSDFTKKYIILLLPKTSVNIQDYDGNTILLFLTRGKVWELFQEILVTKKMDAYIKNRHNEAPIDFVPKNKLSEFIDLLTNSYLHYLETHHKKWTHDWENSCNKCLTDIKQHITKNKISYPISQDVANIKVEIYPDRKIVTYTGTPIDSLSGLLYLLKKHNKQVCNILTTNFMSNKELDDYYKSLGIIILSNFSNLEIEWSYNKLFFPVNFKELFNNCRILINRSCHLAEEKSGKKTCSGKRFIIIPLHIMLKRGGHSNYLIYDHQRLEIERFEPHGSNPPIGFDYSADLLDLSLETQFKEFDKKIKYISPKKYLPRIGFQLLDGYEKKSRHIGDPGGFCECWSVWYTNLRLLNPNIRRKKLVKELVKKIRSDGVSFKNMIRNFAGEITKYRNSILTRVGLSIHSWYYNNYTDAQKDNLIMEFQKEIKNLH